MTFLNPLLLLGALGIALPILAHLINRQQVKRTDWAAMQFLNTKVRVRSRQIRLRDLLLLAMRCLAILLLVFALARPATDSTSWSWMPGEERAGVVIALDGSYSMSQNDGEQTRFERAIEQIGVIREHLKPGDPVTLVLLGEEHDVALRNIAYNPDRFDEVLQQQAVLDETLDLDSVPKFLETLAVDLDAQQKEVYILTDTQARDWNSGSITFQDALKQLSSEARVFVVPVTGSDANLAVTGLELVSGTLRKGSVARYQATVHNFGTRPVSDIEVRCRVEGVQIDRKRIPVIEPGTSETVSLFVPFYNAGSTRITAEISGDSVETDNTRRVVAVVRERVKVVCIDGSASEATRLLASALKARADGAEDEDYEVETFQWPNFPIGGLDDIDVMLLADVPKITEEQAEQVEAFVRRGNGLIWFAGENVKASEWNALADKGVTLLPASLGIITDSRDGQGVGTPLDQAFLDHSVCRPLRALPEDLLSETRFLQRIDVEPKPTSFSVLNLAGSTAPLLLEQSLGRGHVFMFTSSAHTAWNNMAQTPVFPMLLQQLVTHLAGRAFESPRLVGDALMLSYTDAPDATDAVFDSPSEQSITVPVREHRDEYVALLEQSDEAGFYLARMSVQAPGMPIAVNVDTRESDVSSSSSSELIAGLEGTGVTVSATQADLTADIATARTGRSSWRYFMIVALVLLVSESLLADRLYQKKQTTSGQVEPSPQPVGAA
ncbi:MAG: BatA domain-containing protein [Planctomycetota bacterium]